MGGRAIGGLTVVIHKVQKHTYPNIERYVMQLNLSSKAGWLQKSNTAKSVRLHTGKFLFICFCNFEHVPTRILKQMIYHWKALI